MCLDARQKSAEKSGQQMERIHEKIYDRRNFALYLSPVCPGNLAFWHIGTYEKIIWKKSKLQYFNYSRFLSFSFHFVSFCVCFSFFSDTDAVGFPLLFRVIISRLFAIVHRVRIQLLLLLLRRRERISYCLIGVCTVCSVHFSFAFVRRISSLQFAYTFFFWFWLCKLCKGFSVVPFVLAHSLAWSLFARGFVDLNSTTIKREKIDCVRRDSFDFSYFWTVSPWGWRGETIYIMIHWICKLWPFATH